MSNYLVTGGAGFIGSSIAKRLIGLGHKVFTIDNLSTGFRNNIPEGVIFIEGNCQDSTVIDQLLNERFDTIFHIAGQSSGEISFDEPVYDLQTNTQSTLLLLKYAEKTKCKKFIYASTMSVYGDQPIHPVIETMTPVPQSFYAVGKLASEQYMRIYQQFGIQSTALRLFSVYGPGQNLVNLKQGIVSIYLAMALQDRFIQVKGSPDRYRDLVYIDDVVDAFLDVNNREGNDFKIYNISTNAKTTIKDLVSAIQNALQYEVKVEYKGRTMGDMFGIYGNYDKIQQEFGWYPKVLLDKGLNKMVNWAINKI
jgi:UDP-glucose 4-epimerase